MFITRIVEALLLWTEKRSFDEKITVEMLAVKSGYSKGYIQKIFKERTGFTFGSYVRGRKLTRAAFILKMTRSSIRHIVSELQFKSYQSFEKAFRKQFKMSPLQYRKNKIWDFTLACPLLFLNDVPEHRYVYFSYDFDEPNNTLDIAFDDFIPSCSSLRVGSLKNITTSNGVINHYKFSASDINDNYVSINFKSKRMSEVKRLPAEELYSLGQHGNGIQLYAEFKFTGRIYDVQRFILEIYTKALPINKFGIVSPYFIESIKQREDDIVDVCIYIPIVNKKKYRITMD